MRNKPRFLDKTRGYQLSWIEILNSHVRDVLFLGLTLASCAHDTLAPPTQADWMTRDKQLMSKLPYAQADIPERYRRHIVDFPHNQAPGTIVIDTENKFLCYVLPDGKAICYGVTVGKNGRRGYLLLAARAIPCIHGTNRPTISVIRITNEHVPDLHDRVGVGTLVIVLAPTTNNSQL